MLDLLIRKQGGSNILLYGAPGTGKTSFAHALCKKAGIRLFELKRDGHTKLSETITAIARAIEVCANAPDRALLVDEADRIIETGFSWLMSGESVEKGRINRLLDHPKIRIIWISNSVSGMELSTRRRFSCAVEFHNYTTSQRFALLQKEAAGSELFGRVDKEELRSIAEAFPLNPGPLTDAMRSLEATGLSREEAPRMLRHLLGQYTGILHGSNAPRAAYLPCREYSPDCLMTDYPPGALVKAAGFFLQSLSENEHPPVTNMNILLSGPPGTGKTEFVKYLAKTLERELVVKKASDLQSMWVGETEQRIAAAFREASDDGAVLFIDEADTFLHSRENAGRSWEVSRVNELLCQMENHRGILICATNFVDSLDGASYRRFSHKVVFDFPDPAGKLILMETTFGKGKEDLTPSQKRRLARVVVGPGDFKVVKQQLCFEDGKPGVDKIIDMLEKEAGFRSGKGVRIGF